MTPSTIRDGLRVCDESKRSKLRRLETAGRVWTIVNVEIGAPTDPMPRASCRLRWASRLPDAPTGRGAKRDEDRVLGFLEALDARGLKASFAVNGTAARSSGDLAGQPSARWDFVGHGYVRRPMHRVEDQRSAIHDRSRRSGPSAGSGREVGKPRAHRNHRHTGSLAEAGIEYVYDLCVVDQPVMIQASPRRRGDALHSRDQRCCPSPRFRDIVLSKCSCAGIDHFDRL